MTKANEVVENETPKKSAPVFSKEQLIRSERYAARRDLLNALLDDNKQYTYSAVDAVLNTYLKGKVS